MAAERVTKNKLHDVYFDAISALSDDEEDGKQIIDILGGASAILFEYLLNTSLSLSKNQLDQIGQILSKKVNPFKQNEQDIFIRSDLFSDIIDQQQYRSIFDDVKCCNLQIPSVIIKDISEFAVGQIRKCENFEQCNNDLSVMNGDHEQSTQLAFDETDDEWDTDWREERAQKAVSEIGFFQCDDKIFCKQCVLNYRNMDHCRNCDELCCTKGFQCNRCEDEWFACCDVCKIVCPMCGITIGVSGHDRHEKCHVVAKCCQCNKQFCPSSFKDGICQFCPTDHIETCPECTPLSMQKLISVECKRCGSMRSKQSHTNCSGSRRRVCCGCDSDY
eukprot:64503_1